MKNKIKRLICATLAALMLLAAPSLTAMAAGAEAVQNAVAQVASEVPLAASSTASKGRWVKKNGKRYRYNAAGKMIKNKYFKVGAKRYYAKKSGVVISKAGWFTRSDGVKTYARSGGVIKSGVITVKGTMYYVSANGTKKNGHFKAGNYYYLTKNGIIKKGWQNSGSYRYYVKSNGRLATGKTTISGKSYTFNSKGQLKNYNLLTATLNGKVVTAAAETILSQIVMAEVGGFQNKETYKAQAIAAHTYLRYQYANGNKAPVMPAKTPIALVTSAVKTVANIYLTHNGKPALTTYYASSNGKTNPSQDFWYATLPYLQSVSSVYDKYATGYSATKTITRKDFLKIMDNCYPSGYTLPSDPKNWIIIQSRNAQGYVTGKITLGNKQPSVEVFYQTIVGIRSPDFTVTYNKSTDSFVFTTRGYGHGVGMSQWGAYFYNTKEGWNYKKILSHYYPGTTQTSVT